MRRFLILLLSEILAVVVAMSSFRFIHDRLVAGAVAGMVFVIIGVVIFVLGLKDARFRRSFTFVFGCIHLFLVALPLMTIRLLNSAAQFNEVKIWGLSGPVFHQVSGVVYWLLMIGTLVDAGIAWWLCRKNRAR